MKKGMEKQTIRISPKKLDKNRKLCYSVNEVRSVLNGMNTRMTFARSDRQNVCSNKCFNIRRRYSSQKEITADMYSIRKVYPVKVLSIRFLYRSVRSDEFGEIVHYQTSPYFLKDTLRLFCVKM